jgi:hypothetical protein
MEDAAMKTNNEEAAEEMKMTAMTKWRVVAWGTRDGFDVTTPPVAIETTVEAESEYEASSKGYDAVLPELEKPPGLNLLNWYVREVGRRREEETTTKEDTRAMAIWRVVGWATRDPMDMTTPPVPIAGIVRAANEHEAYGRGHDAVVAELERPLRPLRLRLMNWYAREIRREEEATTK